jgi:hypothetical protein
MTKLELMTALTDNIKRGLRLNKIANTFGDRELTKQEIEEARIAIDKLKDNNNEGELILLELKRLLD